jgi:hypothetical protein
MNRKIVRRIIESEREAIPLSEIHEADDGVTAVEMVRADMDKGEIYDFILIDFIMVRRVYTLIA